MFGDLPPPTLYIPPPDCIPVQLLEDGLREFTNNNIRFQTGSPTWSPEVRTNSSHSFNSNIPRGCRGCISQAFT